jgi:VWFA-related protein
MLSRRRFVTGVAGFAAQGRSAQHPELKTSTSVVLAPTVVRDQSGKFVRGVPAEDFLLFDNGARRPVNLEPETMPVALVLALQATFDARKPLDRMRKAVSLFGPLVVGEGGKAALLAIRDDVQVAAPFTSHFVRIERAASGLEARGDGCSFVDAVKVGGEMLREQPVERRKVIIVMAEARDRTSSADLQSTLLMLQRYNTTVYALTYSPGLMQFGKEVPTAPNVFEAVLKQGRVADVFALATGGRHDSFFRQNTVERLIAEIGEELHAQYILSFAPVAGEAQGFRILRASVSNRPELNVRTRSGYWPTAD